MTNFMVDPLAGIEQLIGPAVTDFPSTPDTYSPANRPQDIRYEFPERGAESHGVNDDAPTDTYFPNQTAGDARIITDDGSRNIYVAEELIAPDPVAVFEVPNPLRSIRKWSRVDTLYTGVENATTASLSGPDLSTVLQLGADENRVRVTLVAQRPYSAFANQVLLWWIAVSNDPLFQSYGIFGFGAASNPITLLTIENCKEPLYFALAPMAAQDPTKYNIFGVVAISEYATPIDHNPVQAD